MQDESQRGEEDERKEEARKAERIARQDRKEPAGGVARPAALAASPTKMIGMWNRQEAAGTPSGGAGSRRPGAGGGSRAAAFKQPSADKVPTLEALCEMAAEASSSDDE